MLTHWGRVTYICVSKLTSIGSDNGLSPGWRQAIIWTNVGILFIETLGTNFSEISIEIHTFSFKKMHVKMSSGKWRPCCLGLNVLNKCNVCFRSSQPMVAQLANESSAAINQKVSTTLSAKIAASGLSLSNIASGWLAVVLPANQKPSYNCVGYQKTPPLCTMKSLPM